MDKVTQRITLPSGCRVDHPFDRLLTFCNEEYAYYDGLPTGDPNAIEPIDILATVSVNGLYSANAARVRAIHRGLASSCTAILSNIAPSSDLLDDADLLRSVRELLHRAVSVPQVLIPVATKVLHRKRPRLIPILDNVVLEHYLGKALPAATQDKSRAAGAAMDALELFRRDLATVNNEIDMVVAQLSDVGFAMSRVRALEVLL